MLSHHSNTVEKVINTTPKICKYSGLQDKDGNELNQIRPIAINQMTFFPTSVKFFLKETQRHRHRHLDLSIH
jgi:hypothetical protein